MKNIIYLSVKTVPKVRIFNDLDKNDISSFLLHAFRHNDDYNLSDEAIEKFWNMYAYQMAEYNKIVSVAVGVISDNDSEKLNIKDYTNHDEFIILKSISNILKKVDSMGLSLCGYNIKNFDILQLYKKFIKYDIEMPQCLKLYNIKPWESNIIDIVDLWRNGQYSKAVYFEDILSFFGFDVSDHIYNEDISSYYYDNNLIDIAKSNILTINYYHQILSKII